MCAYNILPQIIHLGTNASPAWTHVYSGYVSSTPSTVLVPGVGGWMMGGCGDGVGGGGGSGGTTPR